tara:strand:+ start:1045 stop:1779 length:735 start_codon:yes stop_codon:yes gene_type:complete
MDKILIVTGGGRGIGAAVSIRAAEEGWDVCIGYRVREEDALVIEDSVKKIGRNAITVQVDVSRPEEVVRLFDNCISELGCPLGLVNSAGILDPISRIDEIGNEDLLRHVSVNITGTMFCSGEAIKRMSWKHHGKGGVIVNLSSRASELGGAGASVHYGACKAAVNAFTFGLAQEVAAEGIRVCAVSPGVIDTEIQPAGRINAIAESLPMKRAGKPEEVANAIVWLLSKEASYVSGAVINVSGAR